MKTKKTAIITGASRGIGKEIAKGLAEDSYNLLLISRDEKKLRVLQDEINHYPIESKILVCDITNFEKLTVEVSKILSEWDSIDILVNNAGIFKGGSIETSLEDYQELFDVNFKAQLALIKIVIPFMQKQKHGYIFNIASIAGKIGFANIGAYTSSKFALVGLSESLYEEYSSQGIKVTSICPGYVDTDMAKGASISEDEMIQPKDILQTIRWLISLSPTAFVKEIIINTSS